MKLHHGVALCAICVAASAMAVVMAACAAVANSAPTTEHRQVVVQVHVATPTGIPVPNAPVGVYCKSYLVGLKGGKTNANGNVSITASVPITAKRLAVRPTWPGTMTASVVVTPDDSLRQQLVSVVQSHSFVAYQWVSLQPEVTNYTVEMVAKPASKLIATIRDADGTLNNDHWIATLKGHLNVASVKRDSTIELFGLERSAVNELFLQRGSDRRVLRSALTAEQCQSEVIEGVTITAPAIVRGAKLRCTLMLGPDDVIKHHPLDLTQGITLVEATGACAYEIDTRTKSSEADASSLERVSQNPSGEGEWFSVPPGTYYVGPGLITDRGGGFKLWDLVLAGRQADLEDPAHPGIVKVTIAAGSETEVSINLVAAISAIGHFAGED